MKDQKHVIITLLSCVTHVIGEFQCQGTCYSGSFPKNIQIIKEKHLSGYSYKNITTDVPQACFSSCINDCRCKAFQMKNVRCELLDEDKTSKAADFVDDTGYVYYELRQKIYKGKSHMVWHLDVECHNGCCRTQPCMNGGTCVEHCEEPKVKFSCKCPATHKGKICEIREFSSCIDVFKGTAPGTMPANGTYIITRSDTKTTLPVYCAFASPKQAWTLIESFALVNKQLYMNKAFSQNISRNHLEPNWDDYRLSLSNMQYLQNKATMFRATCDYEKRSSLIPDVLIGYKKDLDIIAKDDLWHSCINFAYINIRGTEFTSTKAPVWQRTNKWHLHLDISCFFCGFSVPGTKSNEDVFGHYFTVNELSTCTATKQSTTQWWIGEV